MSTSKLFYIFTLGCKVNQYESQALVELWESFGWQLVDPEDAKFVIVNSCAITAKAVSDVRSEVRKLSKRSPHADIIITGCATTAASDELKKLPHVKLLIDQQQKSKMLTSEFASALEAQEYDSLVQLVKHVTPADGVKGIQPLDKERSKENTGFFPPFAISGYGRSRAVLKIQDGCSHFCTYCIVPYARGRAYSRQIQDSLAEAKRLLEAGFGEIVISGINLRQYKHSQHDFWDFITLLEDTFSPQWAGKSRFRISSLEPGQLDNRALQVLSRSKMIAPQLHLSLQSGSSSVLKRMKRGHYSLETIHEFLLNLEKSWPIFGLGVDVISGFPGETEEEHEATVALLKKLPLTYAHVFPYSQREGTLAATMVNQIDNSIKKQRAAELRSIATAQKTVFLSTLLQQQKLIVAVEGDTSQGVCEFYADCVIVDAENHVNTMHYATPLVPVKPVKVENSKIITHLLDEVATSM